MLNLWWAVVVVVVVVVAVEVEDEDEEDDLTFLFRIIKNLVVFPNLSFMPSDSTSRPNKSAAMILDSAADAPDWSWLASSAARDVELTSCLSACLRRVERKLLHWPQAWGCE